jgi:hypothetical protein
VGPSAGNKWLERGLWETRGESDPSYFDARLETDWDNMIFNPIFVAAANRLTACCLADRVGIAHHSNFQMVLKITV